MAHYEIAIFSTTVVEAGNQVQAVKTLRSEIADPKSSVFSMLRDNMKTVEVKAVKNPEEVTG